MVDLYDFNKKSVHFRIKTGDGTKIVTIKKPNTYKQELYIYDEDEMNHSIFTFLIELFHLIFRRTTNSRPYN